MCSKHPISYECVEKRGRWIYSRRMPEYTRSEILEIQSAIYCNCHISLPRKLSSSSTFWAPSSRSLWECRKARLCDQRIVLKGVQSLYYKCKGYEQRIFYLNRLTAPVAWQNREQTTRVPITVWEINLLIQCRLALTDQVRNYRIYYAFLSRDEPRINTTLQWTQHIRIVWHDQWNTKNLQLPYTLTFTCHNLIQPNWITIFDSSR